MEQRRFRQTFKEILQRDVAGLQMNINTLATVTLAPNWKKDNARQPYVRMYYIQSGYAEIHYRDKQIDLLPGNIYLIPSELDYGYSCPDECFKLFCHFTLIRHDYQDVFAKVDQCIILENRMETVNEVIRLFEKGDPESCVRLKMILQQSAFEGILKSGIDFSQFAEHSPLIEDAIDYIIANCRITLSAAEIADKLCVAPATLQKQFKKEVGTPLGQYIQKMVLRRAEIDIRNTDTLIKEISESYGFSDQFYFHRLFYKHYHMSPSTYRKRRYIV